MLISEISTLVQKHLHIPKDRATEIVNLTIELLLLVVASGQPVTIPKKGKFIIRVKPPKVGTFRGEQYTTKEKKTLVFVPKKAYKAELYGLPSE